MKKKKLKIRTTDLLLGESDGVELEEEAEGGADHATGGNASHAPAHSGLTYVVFYISRNIKECEKASNLSTFNSELSNLHTVVALTKWYHFK